MVDSCEEPTWQHGVPRSWIGGKGVWRVWGDMANHHGTPEKDLRVYPCCMFTGMCGIKKARQTR